MFTRNILEVACLEMYEMCSDCSRTEFIIRQSNMQLVYLILVVSTVLLETAILFQSREVLFFCFFGVCYCHMASLNGRNLGEIFVSVLG